MPPLSFYAVSLRKDLFCEATGEILLDLGKLFVKGEVFWQDGGNGSAQIVPAFHTKVAIRGYAPGAFRAGEFELFAALFAELGTIRQLDLALWAIHGFPHQAMERGGLVNP
jgi:hypothetical protein